MSDADVRRFRFGPILAATTLTVFSLWLIIRASQLLVLLFIAILISLYLGAIADLLSSRFGISRRLGFFLGLLATIGAVSGLFYLLVPPVVQQTQTLIRVLPDYLLSWEAGLLRLAARFPFLREVIRPGENQVLHAVYGQIAGLLQNVGPKVLSFVHAAINVFAVIIMSIYLSLYPGMYREWLLALFPPTHRDLARDVLHELAETLRAWIVGQLLSMLILAFFTALGLYLLGVPFWLPFGLFTGAVAFVPFFGTLLSTILPAIFVLGGDGFHGLGPGTHALLVILLGTVIHLIESNVVIPLITARQVELPPVLTIMSVLVVGSLLGPLGLIIAVPLLAATMVIVRRIVVNRVYEGHGFRKMPRDRVLVLRVPAPEGGVLLPQGLPPDPIALLERMAPRKIA